MLDFRDPFFVLSHFAAMDVDMTDLLNSSQSQHYQYDYWDRLMGNVD